MCVYVVECVGVKVDRVVFGSLMTSLEMAGVSLTLLKLEPGWDQYLGKGCLSCLFQKELAVTVVVIAVYYYYCFGCCCCCC